MRFVDDLKAGRLIRAVRVRLRLRQDDLGRIAGVHQRVVYLIESGQLERVSVRRFRRVCAALQIDSSLELRWRGGLGDRLVDAGHAGLVETVLAELVRAGWETLPEHSFNVYGDRGSVDILAWHAATRTLLIIEVKTILTDLQATFISLSRKVRVVPGDVERLGWHRLALGNVIVVAATHGNRSTVASHQAMFDAVLPSRTVDVKRWIRSPHGDLGGVWFVPVTPGSRLTNAASTRVRLPHAQRMP